MRLMELDCDGGLKLFKNAGVCGDPLLDRRWAMNWLVWLILAAIIAAVAAVTGLKPKGTRHAYLAFRARAGG